MNFNKTKLIYQCFTALPYLALINNVSQKNLAYYKLDLNIIIKKVY